MELAARGHEVHFITYALPSRLAEMPDEPEVASRVSFHEVEVSHYPLFDYPPYELALATQMAEVAEHYQLDLLHVHYAIPHSVSALLAQQMLKPRRLPFVTTLHGTDITLVGQDRSYLPITRFAIEQSDGVTAVSEYLRALTLRDFNVRKPIELISNFVNCERYQRGSRSEAVSSGTGLRGQLAGPEEPIVAHLSNFRPVKRLPDVIEVFARVRRARPAKLLLIGDGPERPNAEWLVREKGLAEDVQFLGKQDRVHEKLALADLFLLPSELESFGLAALEAMACEVPVIATHVGGVPEVITDGESGYLVAVGDVGTMAARALELLANPEQARAMGARARAAAQKRFCSTLVIPRYEAFYQRVLEQAH
ncbi:MAG: N-acetyl-alpha-D-glucosaminyl L-malate synthase BshA [Terriglobia bacterium]